MKKTIVLVAIPITILLAEDTIKSVPYQEFVRGSISARYTIPFNGDTYVNAENTDADAITTFGLNLHLLPNYYGGLYVGYEMSVSSSNEISDFYLEKRYQDYSFYFRRLSSTAEIIPKYMDDFLKFYDQSGNWVYGKVGIAQQVPYDFNRYELRNYCWQEVNGQNVGYIALVMEDITKVVIERDASGDTTESYYTHANIKDYALSFGIKQEDYELEEGFSVSKISADLGVGHIAYSDDYSYGDNGVGNKYVITWGTNMELAYKRTFTDTISFIGAAYGGYTQIGNEFSLNATSITSYGNVGLRAAMTF